MTGTELLEVTKDSNVVVGNTLLRSLIYICNSVIVKKNINYRLLLQENISN